MLDKSNQSQVLNGNSNILIQINGSGNQVLLKPDDIENFEQQGVLFTTIEYILKENNFTFNFAEEINLATDIQNKITVNNVNPQLNELLKSGISKRYLIDELFEDNQKYNLEDLRKDIIRLYNRHRNVLDDMNIIIQKLYNDIFDKFKKRNADISISVFIIISYFFEICDIGDNPNDNA